MIHDQEMGIRKTAYDTAIGICGEFCRLQHRGYLDKATASVPISIISFQIETNILTGQQVSTTSKLSPITAHHHTGAKHRDHGM